MKLRGASSQTSALAFIYVGQELAITSKDRTALVQLAGHLTVSWEIVSHMWHPARLDRVTLRNLAKFLHVELRRPWQALGRRREKR